MAKNIPTARTIIAELVAKGYTPTQVVNSVARSLAHVEKNATNPVLKSVWRKADALAKTNMTNVYAEAAKTGAHLPCDARCMDAHEDECNCLCGGVNHGVLLAH